MYRARTKGGVSRHSWKASCAASTALLTSAFEEKVWRYTKKIPKGRVTTYSLLAKAVGKPNAARAVGNALNKNPFAPQVPCHRVVKSDGSLGGFAKGSKKKAALLRKEGILIHNSRLADFNRALYRFNSP